MKTESEKYSVNQSVEDDLAQVLADELGISDNLELVKCIQQLEKRIECLEEWIENHSGDGVYRP